MAVTVRSNYDLRFNISPPPFPASVSGRKILDQYGAVYPMLTASAWSLPDLSDTNITAVLEGLQSAGFNAVTCWSGGGYDINATWQPAYQIKSTSDNWWSGTPWASSLGPGWAQMDYLVQEALNLNMVVNFSFCGGFDTTGAGPEWEAVTNTNMRDVGVAVATRYPKADFPNIVWHFMLDDANSPASTRGQRISALFDGINDTEGTVRPVRWMEPNNGATTSSQGWMTLTDTNVTMNSMYEYTDNHVDEIRAAYGGTSAPTVDCEPPYDGSSNAGASHAGLRMRVGACYIEGFQLVNWGHEDLWPFGKTGLFTEGLTYTQVLTHSSTQDAGRIFQMLLPHIKVSTWAPSTTFVTAGESTLSNRAAQGASGVSACAMFPNSRAITIDTTILNGTNNVRLRWFDPTNGAYTTIAASEAQQTGRSVTHPGSNNAGGTDWILVAELL